MHIEFSHNWKKVWGHWYILFIFYSWIALNVEYFLLKNTKFFISEKKINGPKKKFRKQIPKNQIYRTKFFQQFLQELWPLLINYRLSSKFFASQYYFREAIIFWSFDPVQWGSESRDSLTTVILMSQDLVCSISLSFSHILIIWHSVSITLCLFRFRSGVSVGRLSISPFGWSFCLSYDHFFLCFWWLATVCLVVSVSFLSYLCFYFYLSLGFCQSFNLFYFFTVLSTLSFFCLVTLRVGISHLLYSVWSFRTVPSVRLIVTVSANCLLYNDFWCTDQHTK